MKVTEQRLKILPHQRQEAAFGLADIASAFSSRDDSGDDFVRKIKSGMRFLDSFLNDIYPAPELTEQEANLSASLHTYQRKFMDSYLSSMLYSCISENRGRAVWYAFIKGLIKNNYNMAKALSEAEYTYKENQNTESLCMYGLLDLWSKDGLEDAIKKVKSW